MAAIHCKRRTLWFGLWAVLLSSAVAGQAQTTKPTTCPTISLAEIAPPFVLQLDTTDMTQYSD